ncbi:MAG: hypothetical protein QF684_07455 [Candidatus Thalassarchaeaceae archaeon]|nr:hypothetical protein [Candidatus Thalassarchaeaceae archaeon]
MSEGGVSRSVAPLDVSRLESEMANYQAYLDEKCEEIYQLAGEARSKGFDLKDEVEIPRAIDLADRAEKLLEDYLRPFPNEKPIPIQDDIRKMLAEKESREDAAIDMAVHVALQMHDATADVKKSVDTGLRVGLAVLTEAVLVAPLEGIGQVRILNNLDGTRFVSIDFCGPIRAAGGTAQALAVLIADMIRRALKLDKYEPTVPEIERVKEEFGLYRGGLQYKPPPEEIEMIVKACPIMINGEETESIECAGYREVRNIDGGRIRGGVMLVIGEGLCLKAAKIQKHTERLEIPGWGFISTFASRQKKDTESTTAKRRKIKTDNRFMGDIIAGRPVFGEPNTPGGFRLRYGRPRTSGLAAAGVHPASMHAMGDFLAVGTQMKIERPGKACAVVPCDDLDGPTVLLNSGRYGRIQSAEMWHRIEDDVLSIWDNGELMIGYGEFAENNKPLVPSGYVSDWFASDLLEKLDSAENVEKFASVLGVSRRRLPEGLPSTGSIDDSNDELENHRRQRTWHRELRKMILDWDTIVELSRTFLTAIPPPWNLWWNDLPLEFTTPLIDTLLDGEIEPASHPQDGISTHPHPDRNWMRLSGAVAHWEPIDHTPEKLPMRGGNQATQAATRNTIPKQMPGQIKSIATSVLGDWPNGTHHQEHGIVKSALMILGVPHMHDGSDILIMHGWQPLIEGMGLQISANGTGVEIRVDAKAHLESRLSRLVDANQTCNAEKERVSALEMRRSTLRIAAETAARQRGDTIAETEIEGQKAAEEIIDDGPNEPDTLESAESLLDEHGVDGALWLVRKCSDLRWVAAAPCRIGCRMGRPEKAAPREMKGKPHCIFPIGNEGGPQRLITEAANKGTILVTMGTRECTKCGQRSPYTICHHRMIPTNPTECGGQTRPIDDGRPSNGRRKGINQSVNLPALLETKRIKMGLDRIPKKFKGVKGLTSAERYPEPLEKGILRAIHQLPAFKAGTIRFDMIDVPVTHFKPKDIGTDVGRLIELGYTHDIDGRALTKADQILELYPQDFIPSRKAEDYLLRASAFVDELLVRFYDMEPFYKAETANDLVGHLCVGLAPHTSGGVLTRLIGWSNASAGYGHTLYHAAKRRNCDGDEDALILLLDCLLNFSRELLPSNRGGRMDAPLTLSTRLNPEELDKEALNVDTSWWYHRGFYEATQNQPNPAEIANQMDIVDRRKGSVGAVRGYGFTHDAQSIDSGPENSSYKTLDTMIDKMNAQLLLCQQLRGVDVRKVASQVVESHFLPDLRGNLLAFTRQKFRCVRCGESYRRFPLAGNCIKDIEQKRGRQGMRSGIDFARGEAHLCGGNLALTVSEGAVRKYIRVMQHVIEHYEVNLYTRQRVEGLVSSADSLFKNDRVTVFTLDDFISG